MFHGENEAGEAPDATLRHYFPDFEYKGIFLDVGAFEPIKISDSYHFERNGWTVHCFEANSKLIPLLKEKRQNVHHYAISNEDKDNIEFNVVYTPTHERNWTAGLSAIKLDPRYMQTFGHAIKEIEKIIVNQRTLNTLLTSEIAIDKIDILTIDVEGSELNVLKGIDLDKYAPKIIMVEDLFEDQELHQYLIDHGYKLDKRIVYNKFYLRN